MATQIADLTDDELREQLIEYGVNVGPIVSSTRLFYEKKLSKVIAAGGVPPHSETEESEEEEDEEEVEEEEVQFNYRQHTQSVPRPAPGPQYTSTPVTQNQSYTPVTQARVATPTTATRRNVPSQQGDGPTSATKPKTTEKQSKGGISMWIKLLFVVIVAFLVYLVIINMNPSAENKIPLTFDDSV
ncbi:emerin homolog 1-like isoform X1 [Ruditapes philippinarum]|uniref:emerin homolog 1-like isoform X1 n=1 Tax=Ruditapes philippinarum TaxID=129788 RepID=UPI00295AA04A|nr:emerin homolog 1-like isoform X1 [Ruditapes philippinarum]